MQLRLQERLHRAYLRHNLPNLLGLVFLVLVMVLNRMASNTRVSRHLLLEAHVSGA